MNKLIIFIGHPAGGKTSTAHKLADILGGAEVIETDKVKQKISGSIHARDNNERELWFKEINNQIKTGVDNNKYTIIDEGFFSVVYLNKILADIKNINKTIIEITYSLDEHIKRDKKRGGTEPEAIVKMFNVWNKVPEDKKIKANIEIHNKNLSQDQIVKIIYKKL